MRIGYSSTIISPEFMQQFKIDGVGTYTKFLYENLLAENYTVIPYRFRSLRTLFQKYPDKKNLQPLAILSAILPSSINLHKSMTQEIDIFHSTDYLIPRLKNIPVVASLHDATALKHPEMYSKKLRRTKNYFMKYSARWADHVITLSHAMVDDIVNYWNIPAEKISVVHLGVEPHWSEPVTDITKQKILAKYKISKAFILFVGTLQPRKNIVNLINAYNNLAQTTQEEFQLVLVGKQGWRTDAIMPHVDSLVASGKGLWLNYVDREDLPALYQAARIFFFPSLSEGFGLPILEAFASGTPVIASNTTSLPEIAGDAAYLINPMDIDEMTHAIKLLLDDISLQRLYREKAKARVKNFTWQQCAKNTYQVYQQIMTGVS